MPAISRTNLTWDSNIVPLSSTVTTGVSYAGRTDWQRVTVASPSLGIRTYAALADLVNGETYTASWTVANDGASPQGLYLDWCDTPVQYVEVAPAEIKRVSVTGSIPVYDASYRFGDLALATAGNILVADMMIERSPVATPFFKGSSLPSGPFTYAWTGTANASKSTENIADLVEQTIPSPYGITVANNSKASLRVKYRSGWTG